MPPQFALLTSLLSFLKLAVAVYLFSRTLRARSSFPLRVFVVAAVAVVATFVSVSLGFGLFPPVTSLASFVHGALSFVIVLAISVIAQRFVFDCPVMTSVFCCSMAYTLENLSAAAARTIQFVIGISGPGNLYAWLARDAVMGVVVYLIAYALLIKRIEKNGLLAIEDPILMLVALLAITVNIVLDLMIKDLAALEGVPRYYPVPLHIVYLLLCTFVLFAEFEIVYNRRLLMDVAAIEQLRATEAKQYEMSRENIEAINIKCHDIKHQIRQLQGSSGSGDVVVEQEVLDDIAREVGIYDSVVKTGNVALDTILTEKSLLCEKEGITLSCIADGRSLGFMKPVDLYSLFGNAIDNAMEAVRAIGDPEHRSISLIVRRIGDMISVHVENYFNGSVVFGEDGMPLTSKDDKHNHGFGTRSMRLIVESYDGTISTNTQGDVFHLNALIPVQADTDSSERR